MRNSAKAVLYAAATAAFCNVASAVVVFRDNFENVTGATAPFPQSGVNANPVAQVGSWIIGEPSIENVQVSQDYSPIEGTQCLVSNRNGTGAVALRANFASPAPANPADSMNISFKYRDPAPDSAFGGTVDVMELLGYNDTDTGFDNQAFYMRIFKGWSADPTRVYVGFAGNGSLGAPENNGYFVTTNPDQNWQQVDIAFDFLAHTYTFSMNGSSLPGTENIPFDGDAAAASQIQQLLFYHLYSNNSRWALDDITIATSGSVVSTAWNLNGSGDWNVSGNWSAGAPNGIDASATLGGIISSARTVYTDVPLKLGSLRIDNSNRYVVSGAGSLTMEVSTGVGTIQVDQGSHKISLPLTFASDTQVNVSPGALLTVADITTIKTTKTVTKSGDLVLSGPLVIEAGGSLVSAGGATTVYGTPSLASGASIDTTTTTLNVDYRGIGTPAAAIRSALFNSKIRSSNSVAGQTGLGWLDNGGSQNVTIKLTRLGDANLDGTVSSLDFTAFVASYGATSDALWSGGDFNYDGKINTIDFNLLAGNFGQSAPAAALGAVVPEPASLGLLAVMALAGTRRRRIA